MNRIIKVSTNICKDNFEDQNVSALIENMINSTTNYDYDSERINNLTRIVGLLVEDLYSSGKIDFKDLKDMCKYPYKIEEI